MSTISFKGIANPKGKEIGYDGIRLTEKEIEDNASRITEVNDTPIFEEHGDGTKTVLGKITRAMKNASGELEVEGYISRGTMDGCRVIEEMRSGKKPALSVGMSIDIDNKNWKVLSKTIDEISIVENPDQDGTKISHIQEDSKRFKDAVKVVEMVNIARKLNSNLYKQSNTSSVSRVEKMAQQQPDESGTGDTKALMEKVRLLEEKNQELEQKNKKFASLDPEEALKEKEKRDNKKRKYVEEHAPEVIAYIASLLGTEGKNVEDNVVYQSVKNATENPEIGQPYVKMLAVAHQQSKKSVSAIEEKYQDEKKRRIELEEKYKLVEDQQMKQVKKDALKNEVSGSSGLKPLGSAAGSKVDEQSAGLKRTSTPQTDPRESRVTDLQIPRPPLSGISFNGSSITIKGLKPGDNIRNSEVHQNLFERLKDASRGSIGIDKMTYLGGVGFGRNVLSEGVQPAGNGYFELLEGATRIK